MSKQSDALNVIVKDPNIRHFLEMNDPKTLEQAEAALAGGRYAFIIEEDELAFQWNDLEEDVYPFRPQWSDLNEDLKTEIIDSCTEAIAHSTAQESCGAAIFEVMERVQEEHQEEFEKAPSYNPAVSCCLHLDVLGHDPACVHYVLDASDKDLGVQWRGHHPHLHDAEIVGHRHPNEDHDHHHEVAVQSWSVRTRATITPTAMCSQCKIRPRTAGVYCQTCLDDETRDTPTEELEAAAVLLDNVASETPPLSPPSLLEAAFTIDRIRRGQGTAEDREQIVNWVLGALGIAPKEDHEHNRKP